MLSKDGAKLESLPRHYSPCDNDCDEIVTNKETHIENADLAEVEVPSMVIKNKSKRGLVFVSIHLYKIFFSLSSYICFIYLS